MKHPSYKERLAKEMYGDEIIDEEKQKIIDIEYNNRLQKINNVIINIHKNLTDGSYFNLKTNKISADKESIYHELSHSVDNHENKDTGFNDIKNKYISDPENYYNNFITKENCEKYQENFFHLIDVINKYNNENNTGIKNITYDFIPIGGNFNLLKNIKGGFFELIKDISKKGSDQILKKLKQEDFTKIYDQNEDLANSVFDYEKKLQDLLIKKYYIQNTEIKARLNELRLKAVNELGFDLDSEFNINKLPSSLKDNQAYYDLKYQLNLSDEEINELMKYTAMNESRDREDNFYHNEWDYNNDDNKA